MVDLKMKLNFIFKIGGKKEGVYYVLLWSLARPSLVSHKSVVASGGPTGFRR
jgi:hypothetical protein